MNALRAIAPYVRRRGARAGARCELCGVTIGDEHRHLVDMTERSLRCACIACSLLFQRPGLRYRAAPDRWLHDARFSLDERVWSALQIPVRLAFFFRHSGRHSGPDAGRDSGRAGDGSGWVAFYPGPAGAAESLLSLDAWQELAEVCPLAALVEADVEALLVSGDDDGRFACYLVPIHACYELVGRVKRSWRGFDGGDDAWRQIGEFFAGVAARSSPLPAEAAP
jgi:hypothetical protein